MFAPEARSTMYNPKVYVGGHGHSRQTNYHGAHATNPYSNPYYRHQQARNGYQQLSTDGSRHRQSHNYSALYGRSSLYTSGSSPQYGSSHPPPYRSSNIVSHFPGTNYDNTDTSGGGLNWDPGTLVALLLQSLNFPTVLYPNA